MPPNRLIHEKSPYLQQHAWNPVDWYPWGPEAFEKARQEEKPIFLSIGYSTCHWCHVMERESFQSEEIAAILNRYFVPVKVDREERPDVDRVYMTFVQATTGSGGWPLSVWLTPDLKPFYGGTYFPPVSSYGRPGFREVLERIAYLWTTDRARVVEASQTLLGQLREFIEAGLRNRGPVDRQWCDRAFQIFRREYDRRFGGFGGAPKFPRPSVLRFLLRFHHRAGVEEAREMVEGTLAGMARGGIRDHLGGGFHRYSVDERWFLPHFEKMLYDQAQLAEAYLELYQLTADPSWAAVAREVLEYVLRDLHSPEGAFYSAEDADSPDPDQPDHKAEGAFYLWRWAELERCLEPQVLEPFASVYGCRPEGNISFDPHGEFEGKNLLYLACSVEEAANRYGLDPQWLEQQIDQARFRLFRARQLRPRPHLDDKILAGWNGLMISALAKAGATLEEERYVKAGQQAAGFLIERLYDQDRRQLLRRYRDGEAAVSAFLEDYAFASRGFLDLFEATLDPAWFRWALRLAQEMSERFEDTEQGGFFFAPAGQDDLILAMKDDYDGAEPAGNSVAAEVLVRLARWTGDASWERRARRLFEAFGGRLAATPDALPYLLGVVELAEVAPEQVVVCGRREDPVSRVLLSIARQGFHPNRMVLWLHEDNSAELAQLLPALQAFPAAPERAQAYLCREFRCELPIEDPGELAARLAGEASAGRA